MDFLFTSVFVFSGTLLSINYIIGAANSDGTLTNVGIIATAIATGVASILIGIDRFMEYRRKVVLSNHVDKIQYDTVATIRQSTDEIRKFYIQELDIRDKRCRDDLEELDRRLNRDITELRKENAGLRREIIEIARSKDDS